MNPRATIHRLDDDRFAKQREETLALWETGREVDLPEAVAYQKALPENRSFHRVVERLRREGQTVVFPRGGTPDLEEMIGLCQTLVEAGVPLIPVTTDSYSRQLNFEKVRGALEEGAQRGEALLNGYPLVNHGVRRTRRLVESCEGAFSPRLSRLLYPLGAEIAFASGMSGIASGAFVSFGSYEKTATLESSIEASQYVWRLAGHYAENGVVIANELHGWLPCGVIPSSVNLACMIAEALMAAAQGVKSVIPLVNSMGYLPQDLAWIRLAPRLMREYLDRFGHGDVAIPGTFAAQPPLFPVPQDMGGAFAYLNYTAMIAAMAPVESVFLRTIDEGAGVPTPEAHAVSYRSARWLFQVLREQKLSISVEGYEDEARIAELEIRAILERLLEFGGGDIVRGSIEGVEAGVIDSPFSPNRTVKDRVLGVRDERGGCRYAEYGNLPLPAEAREFNAEKLAERERSEHRKMDYQVSIDDFWAFSKGRLVGRKAAV